MSTGTPAPRHKLIGRYEVIEWLGSGASAAVYLGHDPALDASVAIKVLADHHCAVPEIRERFIQEARILRRISNERVVTIRDIGEVDGQPYFVMDAYNDGTLASRVESSPGPPSPTTLIHLIHELALCLTAVHEAGLIHRDIKPSNLLVRTPSSSPRSVQSSTATTATTASPSDQPLRLDEQLVLGDFGIARDAELTGLTQGVGTSGFMAPEQALPLTTVDNRADIYAATAVIKLLATAGSTDSTASTSLTPALRQAIDTGMAADPADRPQTADDWRDLMTAAVSAPVVKQPPPPVTAAPAVAPARAVPAAPAVTAARAVPAAREATRRVSGAMIGAIALFVGLAIATIAGGLWISGSGDGPEILGPDTIQVDMSAVYTFEPKDGASYVWIDSNGQTFTDEALSIAPRTPGYLSLTLQETINGTTESTTTRIEVTE